MNPLLAIITAICLIVLMAVNAQTDDRSIEGCMASVSFCEENLN